MTLAEVKLYCRIDCADAAEDAQIEAMLQAAKEYMRTAGVEPDDSAKYALSIKALVLHWYSGEREMSPALRSLINQLKFEAVNI